MLRELSVQNLALIEDARVELTGGLCVWTGETGAGKSLLLTALDLVTGGRASGDLVRAGKSEARAAAVFDLNGPFLHAEVQAILGGEIDDRELVLTRRISANGRGSAQVNGLPVPVSTLRKLGDRLLDIHGQDKGRTLLDPDRQRDLLDDYAGHPAILGDYRTARETYDALLKRRRRLVEASEAVKSERALLTYERDELVEADPRPGEADELTREAQRIAHAEELRCALVEGYGLLYESDGSAQESLDRAARRLSALAKVVPDLASTANDLARLAEEVRETARTLRGLGREWDDDPGRAEEIETRLALYRRLAARYRCEPDKLADHRDLVVARLESLESDEAELSALDGPIASAWVVLKRAAEALTDGRRDAGKGFAKAIGPHLRALGLKSARLTVEVEPTPLPEVPPGETPGRDGVDRVEILFAANPGEPPRPLRRVASGGELSRVTLAIKAVLAAIETVPTLIFDEIDAAVGGRLGAVLGRMLAGLGLHRQVLCITHLPQVASYAARQWAIRKEVGRGRTRTSIRLLSDPERVEELAAMLRGESAVASTRLEATAMLAEARAVR